MPPESGNELARGPHSSIDCASLLAPLMRFAKSRVRNVALAEDAVSETLLAALESGRSFATAAQRTAWMYGVLGHKLVDQLRRQGRETPSGDLVNDGITDLPEWDGATAWSAGPDPLSQPEQACTHRELMALLLRCCMALPAAQRHAFMMRELRDVDAAVICRQLGVTEGNLWVLVHRARLRLRESVRLQAWQHGAEHAAGSNGERNGAALGAASGRAGQ